MKTASIYALKNSGVFEGYVGNEPVPIENKVGTPQCFLDVGHTPTYRENGKTVRGKQPVWMRFACFGPIATLVLNHVCKGHRVMVDYEMTPRRDRRIGLIASPKALLVRPVAGKFSEQDPLDRKADELWKPTTARGARWGKKKAKEDGVEAQGQ